MTGQLDEWGDDSEMQAAVAAHDWSCPACGREMTRISPHEWACHHEDCPGRLGPLITSVDMDACHLRLWEYESKEKL